MLNKKLIMFAAVLGVLAMPARADDINLDDFDADGSVFLRITALEQDKVLMRLEKERAQLSLDLSRIEAEKLRLSGAEVAQSNDQSSELLAEFEVERRKMNEELDRFRKQLDEVKSAAAAPAAPAASARAEKAAVAVADVDSEGFDISEHFRIVNITGSEGNLSAMVENLSNGQRRKLSQGRAIDGFTVQSISDEEGVVFEKDGETFVLAVITASR